MQEIGRILREKREELGLTITDVEQRTKIRSRYLAAIEDGDWSVMPGDVYARGFVRAYAEAVGLDGNELLNLAPVAAPVKDGSPTTTVEKPVRQSERVQPAVRKRAPASPSTRARRTPSSASRVDFNAGQVAFIVVILVLLVVGWWLLARSHNHANASGQTSGGQPTAVNQTGQNNATSARNSTGNSTNAANNTTNAQPPTPAIQIASSPQPTGDVTYTVTATPAQALSATLATSTAQCWVQLTLDGVNQGAGGVMLQPNSKQTWKAQKSMVIRVGNPGGVSLTIDGKAVTLPNVNNPINITIVNH